jgi:hypothetical protein
VEYAEPDAEEQPRSEEENGDQAPDGKERADDRVAEDTGDEGGTVERLRHEAFLSSWKHHRSLHGISVARPIAETIRRRGQDDLSNALRGHERGRLPAVSTIILPRQAVAQPAQPAQTAQPAHSAAGKIEHVFGKHDPHGGGPTLGISPDRLTLLAGQSQLEGRLTPWCGILDVAVRLVRHGVQP